MVDDFAGGFIVTQHLIDEGYQRIAHLAGAQHLMIYQDRKNGYMEVLRVNSIPYDETFVIINSLTSEDGIYAVKQFISLANPPDALFCGNDTTARV